MKSISKILSENVRRLREDRLGCTQHELAMRVGMSTRGYQQIEQGGWAKPATIEKIAKELGVLPSVLFIEEMPIIEPTPDQALLIISRFIEENKPRS